MSVAYYEDLRTAFDGWSRSYDDRFRTNRINRFIRRVSLGILTDAFEAPDRVLDIGCGTGQEAVALAKMGVRVLATDLSAEMLDVLRKKLTKEGLSHMVTTRRLAAADLDELLAEEEPGSFDGAYSSLATLNCEPHIEAVPRSLHHLLRPGGEFVASLKNRLCLPELLLRTVTLKPGEALERLRRPTRVTVASHKIDAYPYFPWEFTDLFSPYFVSRQIVAVPALMPPAEYELYCRGLQDIADLAERIERSVSSRFPFRYLGDYFVARLTRVDS